MRGSTMYVAMFAALCAILAVAGAVKGHHYCPPTNEGEDVLYPNVKNCSEFYKCSYGELVPIPCPSGLYYCAAKKWCDYPNSCDYSNCKVPVVKLPQTKENNHEENKGNEQGAYPELSCPTDVAGNDILYPKEDNCNQVYQCYYGKIRTLHCQPGLYYCPTNKRCDYANNCDYSHCKMPSAVNSPKEDKKGKVKNDNEDKDVSQENNEELYCPPTNEEIILYPKAENCSEFYQCSYGQPYTHVCPDSLYYCAAKKFCDYANSCDYSNCKMFPPKEENKDEQVNNSERDKGVEENKYGFLSCNVEGALYPNPQNCNEFYQCSSGRAYIQHCPAGLVYCPSNKACDYPDNCEYSNCGKSHPPKEEKENDQDNDDEQDNDSENNEGVEENRGSEILCYAEGVLYPNPDNCNEFYQCSFGRAYAHHCPPGLYYCASKKVCDYPNNCNYNSCKIR